MLKLWYRCIGFLVVLCALSWQADGAIEIGLDIQGSDSDASTAADKVFVERVELLFANQQTSQSVVPDAKDLYAIARFRYVGNGTLTARWLVDDRVIAQHSMILAFGREVEIRSDQNSVSLPTFEPGYHKVSLQLVNESGLIDESAKSIRYFVGEGVGVPGSEESIALLYPQGHTVGVDEFYFRWQGGKGFSAYQLELESVDRPNVDSKPIIEALSRLDVFSPSDQQRAALKAGAYRWRVKGFIDKTQSKPVTSDWADFNIIQSTADAGGVYIKGINVVDVASSSTLSGIGVKQRDIGAGARLTNSQSVLGRGRVSAGSPYQLQLEVQNSTATSRSHVFVELSDSKGLLGRYPVDVDAGRNAQLDIPLQAEAVSSIELQSLSVRLIRDNLLLDEAAINLTIEPQLRLDRVDFNELENLPSDFSVTDPNGCAQGNAERSMAFTRMVSAQLSGQDESQQDLQQQNYFSFDEGQQVSFKAFFKDKGLGAWFDGPSGSCFVETPGGIVRVVNHPLQFVAQPLNALGQPEGAPVRIGEVTFQTGFEGMINSPPWTIPASGQYKISLQNLGEAADLYATLPGGYPKYIHAAGFITELQTPLGAGSELLAGMAQAIISGQALARWRGDVNGNVIPLVLDQIAVNMPANPLHAQLAGGDMVMKKAPNMRLPALQLYGQRHKLLDLKLGLSGARATLDYVLPQSFQQSPPGVQSANEVRSTVNLTNGISPQRAGSRASSDRLVTDIKTSPSENRIVFEDVAVINGGEFVAQYEFDSRWQDQSINNGDVALRVRGSTLVVDASPILSYTAYTQSGNFTGIGLHNGLLRLKVSARTGLFDVANGDRAFIYGKAPWLYFHNNTLSGESIVVQPADSVQDFWGQVPDGQLQLLQPFGFDLHISGGEFGMADAKVTGLNFAGWVKPGETSAAAQLMDERFYFNHLVRSQTANRFETALKDNASLSLTIDGYRYEPESLQLIIAAQNSARRTPHQIRPAPDNNSENLQTWQQQLQESLQERAGLLALGGKLLRSWELLTGDENKAAATGQMAGAFLLDNMGLHGQWRESGSALRYRINGFDTRINHLWLSFEDSSLQNSDVRGFLDIPYPVGQSFRFFGELDQRGDLWIPADGLDFVEGNGLRLDYWKARLKGNSMPQVQGSNFALQRLSGKLISESSASTYPILYNRELQRIELSSMQLTLEVDDALGGQEFVTESGRPPFMIDTDILPDGQLARTRVYPGEEALFFLGQAFEASEIRFAPFFRSINDANNTPDFQPLVEVEGTVYFKVLGSRQVTIQHTALGAQVPEITSVEQGNYGEGVIKVSSQLKFINSYAMNSELANAYAEQAASGAAAGNATETRSVPQPFKAFVGVADLVIINAVSIRGLAEAGLHSQQRLTEGRWENVSSASIKAYERIGLGAGADIYKATIAGVNALDSAVQLGGSVVSAASGVEGTGEQALMLATDAVSFVGSVGIAVAASVGTGGAGADTIRYAVGDGLRMTNTGIELLKLICDEREDCQQDKTLLLDIASLLVRVAGSVSEFEQLTPKQVASISLQTLDVGIPLLMAVNLDAAYGLTGAPPLNINGTNITLDDKKNAALSVAHAAVAASRTLVDNNMSIPFNDFLRITRRTVDAARAIKAVQGVEAGLNSMGQGQLKQLMELSLDVAEAAIDTASLLSGNGTGGSSLLPRLAGRFMDVLCEKSAPLQTLLNRQGVTLVTEVMEPSLHLSRALLRYTSTQGMPQNSQQAILQLQQLLQSLAGSDGRLQGCGQSRLQLPAAVSALLTMGAHSLQPVNGSLSGNTGAQIAWALKSVSLSVELLEVMAQQIGLNQLPAEVQEIQTVLSRLATTFTDLGSRLNLEDGSQGINAQAILKLAQGIPAAMRELVESGGSRQAAEILDLHIVLMRELQPLLNNVPAMAAGDFGNVDLLALPTALINEIQDLEGLEQCQKSALSNMAMAMGIVRQLSREQGDIAQVVTDINRLYGNVKACDSTGVSDSPAIARFMEVMNLMLAVYQNPDQLRRLVDAAAPRLLPMFMASSQQSLRSINAFVQALPIVDVVQDDRVKVLDTVLNQLLVEAEKNHTDAATLRAIRKARSIINHGNLNLVGLSISRDDDGRIAVIKEVRSDGSWRQFDFLTASAQQFYPPAHPDYTGGLKELIFDISLTTPFEQLSEPDQQSLFTPYWDSVIDQGVVQLRQYRDDNQNHIRLESMDDQVSVQVVNAVSYARFTPQRHYWISAMPERKVLAETLDEQMTALISARVYREYGAENPDCHFSGGCAYLSTTGSGAFTVQSVHDFRQFAIYSDGLEFRSSLDNFKPSGNLIEYQGYIAATSPGWNPDWWLHFNNAGELVLRQGSSQEILDVGEQYNLISPSQIPPLTRDLDRFVHRRVVNGNDIWEYLAGQNIVHSYGDGNWEIYRMPDALPAGTAIPAPQQLLDTASLELMARGDKNGVLEDPAGIASAVSAQQPVLQVTADNSDDVIQIRFSGENGGQVSIGQVNLAVVAQAAQVDDNIDIDQVVATEQLDDGGQRISQSNGDSLILYGTAADNLRISQSETSTLTDTDSGLTYRRYQRRVTIAYCIDRNKSLAACPQAEKYERHFEYMWNTGNSDVVGYADMDVAQRPVISPASGINAAIKHQYWRDIFTLEQSLLSHPEEAGLQQLDTLIAGARAAGLPEDELTQQSRYIVAAVIDRLMGQYFAEADQYINDIDKQNEWRANPSVSPVKKLSNLQKELLARGVNINNNFTQHYLQLLNLEYRLYLHDLQGLEITNNNALLNASLVKKIGGISSILGTMVRMGDDSAITENFDFACRAIDRVKQYVQTQIIDNSSALVLDSDIKLIMNLEENSSIMNCANSNSLLSEIDGLIQRMSGAAEGYQGMVDAMRLRRLSQAIARQDPARDDFNMDGSLDTQDVVYFYGQYMGARNQDVNSVPAPEYYDAWLQHIQNLQRFIRQIRGQQEYRGSGSAFRPTDVENFQQQLIRKLQQGLVEEYQRRYNRFVNASLTGSKEDLLSLAEQVERMKSLHERLQTIGQSSTPVVDEQKYLKVSFNGSVFDPLEKITQLQSQWLDSLWPPGHLQASEIETVIDRLVKQDHVIRYLQDNLDRNQIAGLQNMDQALIARVNQDMDSMAIELVSIQETSLLAPTLQKLAQTNKLLQSLKRLEPRQQLQSRVQQLMDASIARIAENPDNSTLEIQKILAITEAYKGVSGISGGALADNNNLRRAIDEAASARLAIINNGGQLKDVRAFIKLLELQALVGINDSRWSEQDVFARMGELLAEARANLQASNDLALIPVYMDLWAQGQLMGMPVNQDFEVVERVIRNHRQQLRACINNQDCSFEHLRRYIELSTSLTELGADAGDYTNTLQQMLSSFPATESKPLQQDSQLPDLSDIVIRDKDASRGRVAVADALKKLADSFDVGVAAGRDALRLIIGRLRALADLSLPAGHLKPAADADPLLVSANALQQKLNNWLSQLQQQIQSRLENGVLLGGGTQAVADGLGISEQELNDIALAKVNDEIDQATGARIIPANKYRLAALELVPIANLQEDAELRLSLRLLQQLPDPATAVEGDYRLAGILQLSLYMLDSAGEAVPPVVNAENIKRTALGGMVLTLLSLPASEQPANQLFEFGKNVLLPGQDDGETACPGLYVCMLNSSLHLAANVVDSSLLALQQSASSLMRANRQQQAMMLLQKMAANISDLSLQSPDDPLLFWTGAAAEAMNLSLQLAGNRDFSEKGLLQSAMQLSNHILQSPLVGDMVSRVSQRLPQADMAYQFVLGSGELLASQLANSGDANLPVAIARMVQNQLFLGLRRLNLDERLVNTGVLLGNWQLDLADANWALISSADSDPLAWLNMLMGEGGITQLNSRFNQAEILPVKIPAALSLMPFIAAHTWLSQESPSNTPLHKVMADLLADLSNSWFLPLDYSGAYVVENDQPLATMLRQLKNIESSDSPRLKAFKLAGTIGIGGMQVLLPDSTFGRVMGIAWNGGSDSPAASLANILRMGVEGNTRVADVISVVQQLPVTASSLIETIGNSSASDDVARLLRIVALQTRPEDLLAPDRSLNPLMDSILVSLGEVRKQLAPQLVGEQHYTDGDLGYLQTVPFISMENNRLQIASRDEFNSQMQQMVALAKNYNTSIQAVQKISLGGVDIARLGINALAPLLDPAQLSEVAALQQRSIFNAQVGGAGYSGISGGLQREWEPASTSSRENADLVLEMYGQLAFPLLGESAGLMQLVDNETGAYLFFESAIDQGAASRMIGGLEGGIKAELRNTDEGLSLAYWGRSRLQMLSTTLSAIEMSGVVDNFPDPAAFTRPQDYASALLEQVDILQCAQVEAGLPFPVNLAGVGTTTTVGAWGEKDGLALTVGVRAGLSGEINMPVIPSLLGISLNGNITTAYGGELDPATGSVGMEINNCMAPGISLKLLGNQIPLSAGDVESQVKITKERSATITNLKFRITLSNDIVSRLKGDACNRYSLNVVKQGLCKALDVATGAANLWLVIQRKDMANGVAPDKIIMFGISPFPEANTRMPTSSPFIKANISSPSLFLETRVGSWGGWDDSSDNLEICNQQLCDISRFSVAPEAP